MITLWLDFHLALRNVIRQRRRSMIAVGAVAFGVTALLLASGFIEWILMDFREKTIRSQFGHIQVVRPGYHDAGKANPYAFLLPDNLPSVVSESGQSHIEVIAPRLSFSGLVSYGDTTLSFIGDGDDPEAQAAFGNSLQILSGQNLSADDAQGIIMGEGLARNLGVQVGDRVVLMANTANRGVNATEVTVRGTFSTVTKAYDDTALRMPVVTARQLLRTTGSHMWIFLLKDTIQTDAVVDALQNRLKQGEFEVVPWYRLAGFYNKTVDLFSKQVHGIRLIIALIILLSISNTMTMTVMERVGEIGTSMALGVKRAGIMRLFLSEGVMIGLIGSLIGLAAGIALAGIISGIGISMPPPPGTSHGYEAGILVSQSTALGSMALAMGATLVASIYPAWRASRMQIVDALRFNR